MEELKQWALMCCAAILAGGIATLLLPPGSSAKAGKTAVSFFLLSCLILPLRELQGDFSLQLERSEALSQQWQETLTQDTEELSYSLAKGHILELIRARLEQLGLTAQKLDVEFTENDVHLTLILPEEEKNREGELRSLLLREYGLQDAEIIWQEVE